MKYSAFEYALYGELTLVLRGRDVGACISHLQQAGVPLRAIRMRQGFLYCNICLRDFDIVYRTCRKNRVRFRITKRHGLPFWRKRLWRRKAFAVGAVLFVCVIYGMSSMVWQIQVVGPKDEDGAVEIREAAKAVGLYPGQRKAVVENPAQLQQEILAKSPDFVWVGVRTKGSVVTIQAIPKVEGTKAGSETPQDIVATKPAVIKSVSASRGRVLVKRNQYVHPGQVLISGNLAEGEENVPAAGKVMAEVWYTSKVSVPLKVVQDGLTGQTVQRDYLYIGSLKLRIWGWQEPHFADSYERDSGTDWKIGNFVLPIQFQNTKLYEATASATDQSLSQAKSSALELAVSDVYTKMGGDGRILGQSVLHQRVAHGTLYETVLTRVLQDIGAPAAIPEQPQVGDKDSQNAPQA